MYRRPKEVRDVKRIGFLVNPEAYYVIGPGTMTIPVMDRLGTFAYTSGNGYQYCGRKAYRGYRRYGARCEAGRICEGYYWLPGECYV